MGVGGVAITRSRDVTANRRLWDRGLPDDPWCGDHHTFWVATIGGEVAGFCSAVLLPRESSTFLSSAVVFRAFRGHGLQRRMIAHRLRWAKRHGATTALTYTVAKNWPSAANLIRAGFHAYEPEYPWVGSAWYFIRPL